jgi:type II secretory pathway pseudopilin PulG
MPNNQSLSCSLSLGRQKITRVISDPALKFQQLQLQHQQQQQQQQQQHKQQQQQQQQQHQITTEEPHYQIPKNNSAVLPTGPTGTGAYDLPPPKPPRVPRHLKPPPPPPYPFPHYHAHVHHSHQTKPHQASGSDSGNGSGDSEFETSTVGACAMPMQPAMKGIIIRSYHQAKALGLSDIDVKKWEEMEKRISETTPNYEIPTSFDLENFNTLLLPTIEHKPLDATALKGVTGMLHETASRILASHITKIDVDMLLKVSLKL